MGINNDLGPFFTPQEKSLLSAQLRQSAASVAATGSGSSTAATSSADIVAVVTSTSASSDCFRLRDGTNNGDNKRIQYVINRSAAQVRVFAPTGGKLNNTTDGSVTLASGSHGAFISIGSTISDYVKL